MLEEMNCLALYVGEVIWTGTTSKETSMEKHSKNTKMLIVGVKNQINAAGLLQPASVGSLTQHTVITLHVYTLSQAANGTSINVFLPHTLLSYQVRITWSHCESSMQAVVFMSGLTFKMCNLI